MYRSFDKAEDAFMTSEEGLKRGEIFRRRAEHPEERPEVQIDHHGLIWCDNKVLVNLFQCGHHIGRVDAWLRSEEHRAYIQRACGV